MFEKINKNYNNFRQFTQIFRSVKILFLEKL